MFNECLFHLCDCTCSNVIRIYSIAWWSNPKRFLNVLFVFESVFVLKNRGQSLLRVICELFATWLRVTKMEKSFLAFQQKLSQVSHEFATRKIPKSAILWVFHEFLVQNSSYDSFMTPSSPNPLFQSFYIQTQLI